MKINSNKISTYYHINIYKKIIFTYLTKQNKKAITIKIKKEKKLKMCIIN